MRYEAKHSYFKSLSHTLGNYTNLPYSVAMRYQQYVCCTHSGKEECQDDHITTGPDKAIPGINITQTKE